MKFQYFIIDIQWLRLKLPCIVTFALQIDCPWAFIATQRYSAESSGTVSHNTRVWNGGASNTRIYSRSFRGNRSPFRSQWTCGVGSPVTYISIK